MPDRFIEIIEELESFMGVEPYLDELRSIYKLLAQQIVGMSQTIEKLKNNGKTDTFYHVKYNKLLKECEKLKKQLIF